MDNFLQNIGPTERGLIILALSLVIGFFTHFLLFLILKIIAKKTESRIDNRLVSRIRNPLRLLFPLLAAAVSMPVVRRNLPESAISIIQPLINILMILSVTWLLLGVINFLKDLFLNRYRVDVKDNLQARRMHTLINLSKKVIVVIILILAVAAVLMQFENFRRIGTGILASAGIAGIIIGLAAQKTLSNLLAGFQIAITQPIRLDDVVIVEGEFGWIEEISLTYVVVRIWDLRRLVLPISYFIEKPFQNWTRKSADLLGAVYLYVDYSVPVGAIREELQQILKNSSNWDGKVWRLHVTDATEKSLQIRAIMSAPDAGTAWELRCEVREKLVEFMQKNYPEHLPKFRISMEPEERSS